VKRLRVGVLYGGRSGEHEVSLASAAAVYANLDPQRYERVALRIEKDGRWVLADRPPSAASAADVIEQTRTDVTRLRGGREVFMPPRPGEETSSSSIAGPAAPTRRRPRGPDRPAPRRRVPTSSTAPTARTERCRDCSS
jgi:D-alanine-D-alanine ligase